MKFNTVIKRIKPNAEFSDEFVVKAIRIATHLLKEYNALVSQNIVNDLASLVRCPEGISNKANQQPADEKLPALLSHRIVVLSQALAKVESVKVKQNTCRCTHCTVARTHKQRILE